MEGSLEGSRDDRYLVPATRRIKITPTALHHYQGHNWAQAAPTATLALSAKAPRLVGGVAARVTATYSCPTGFVGYLDVQLDQASKGHVSHGYGSNPKALNCNGAKHTMNVSVVVVNDWSFAAGKALGRGTLATWTDTEEASAFTEQTITVT